MRAVSANARGVPLSLLRIQSGWGQHDQKAEKEDEEAEDEEAVRDSEAVRARTHTHTLTSTYANPRARARGEKEEAVRDDAHRGARRRAPEPGESWGVGGAEGGVQQPLEPKTRVGGGGERSDTKGTAFGCPKGLTFVTAAVDLTASWEAPQRAWRAYAEVFNVAP